MSSADGKHTGYAHANDRVTWLEESCCWCGTFLDYRGCQIIEPNGSLRPLVYHRPWPGFVFHDLGEQGPILPLTLTEDPVFEDLDTL